MKKKFLNLYSLMLNLKTKPLHLDAFTGLHAMTLKRIKKRDCFLLDDFNYNILDCEKPQITDFVDQMFDNGFAPLINKPTRISQNNATLLDYIWSNSLVSMKINCGVLTHCISDHLPVIICTSINKISHQNVQ